MQETKKSWEQFCFENLCKVYQLIEGREDMMRCLRKIFEAGGEKEVLALMSVFDSLDFIGTELWDFWESCDHKAKIAIEVISKVQAGQISVEDFGLQVLLHEPLALCQ